MSTTLIKARKRALHRAIGALVKIKLEAADDENINVFLNYTVEIRKARKKVADAINDYGRAVRDNAHGT